MGKKPIDRGWKVSTFDSGLFKLALYDHPTQSYNPSEKASDTIKKVIAACDATVPRKQNQNPFTGGMIILLTCGKNVFAPEGALKDVGRHHILSSCI